MKVYPVLFYVLLLTTFECFAQQTMFENTNQTLISLNPSFAGSNGLFRNQSFYKQYNYRYNGVPFTYYNTLDVYLEALKGGISLTSIYESIGPIKTTGLNLGYAQHFSLKGGKLKIIPSLQLVYKHKSISSLWMTPDATPNYKLTSSSLNLNTGILINYKEFYIGCSFVSPDNQNRFGIFGFLRNSTFHTSYNLKINSKNRLHFSLTSISNVAISELRFTTTAVLLKHLIIAAGIGQDYELNYTGTLGYRTNYFTIQSGYTKWGNYNGGNIFSSISVNLRDKEKRKELTNLETW
jgi:hypothetical protein